MEEHMKEQWEKIKAEAIAQIQGADMPEKLNDVRVRFMGKKGELTAVLKGMKDVAPEDRPCLLYTSLWYIQQNWKISIFDWFLTNYLV